MIFDLSISRTNGIGIFLTILGGAWYAAVGLRETKKKSGKRPRPSIAQARV